MTGPSYLVKRVRQAFAWRWAILRDRMILARARAHRQRMKQTVFVGITGSAGKTTAKDLALAVLGRGGPVTANSASLNYLIDVARLLIQARPTNRFTIVEIAASGPGTVDAKVELVRPTLAALTVVQRDHLKQYESLEAIADEKGKLIHALPPEGTAVLNIDDPLVRRVGEQARAKRIWFGSSPEADIRLVQAVSSYPDPLTLVIEYQGRQYNCVTSLHGTHLAVPVMAAIGLGLAAGIPIEACIEALADVRPTPGRMQIVTGPDGITFLRDDYKAPYWSFQAALDYMHDARATRKVAVIGTLSDYTWSASKVYPKVARQAMEAVDLVVFVGPHALRALKARRSEDDRSLVGFTELEDAHRYLQSELRAGDLVMLKGSNRADHLVRLLLARSQPVSCWSLGCGYNRFCDVCPRLALPVDGKAGRSAAAAPSDGPGPGPEAAAADAPRTDAEPAADDAWLVAAMGNHGEAYDGTPHNVGFAAADALARQLGLTWTADPEGLVCRGSIGGRDALLFKPATLVNVSGPAVERVRQRYGLRVDRVIVLYDDADLPVGTARLKRDGSDGGHKGLRSLFAALRNDGFMPRLRIGVRTPLDAGAGAKSLVLQRFADEHAAALRSGLDKATALLCAHIAASGGSDMAQAADPAAKTE